MAFTLDIEFEQTSQFCFDQCAEEFSVHDYDEDYDENDSTDLFEFESFDVLPTRRCIVCFRTLEVPLEKDLCSHLCKVNKAERQKRFTSIQQDQISHSFHSKAMPMFCSTIERFDDETKRTIPRSLDRSQLITHKHQKSSFLNDEKLFEISQNFVESQNQIYSCPPKSEDEELTFFPSSKPISVVVNQMSKSHKQQQQERQELETDEEDNDNNGASDGEFKGLVSTYTNMFPHSLPKDNQHFFRNYLKREDKRRSQELKNKLKQQAGVGGGGGKEENVESSETVIKSRKKHAKSSVTATSS